MLEIYTVLNEAISCVEGIRTPRGKWGMEEVPGPVSLVLLVVSNSWWILNLKHSVSFQ